jgi:hypothetical protein
MANLEFTDLTPIVSVDRAADLLAVYDDSASSLKSTTTNTLLDLTSHPVGVSDVQTLTNKTITTPTLTVNDNVFTVQDNSDTTKKLQLQLSGITTGTTRTLTIPDANDTLVGLAATQTLTNKTLTSPVINTATIANPTLTTDVVAEYTGANGVTVDGVNLKDGLINTANSIDSLAYVDGSIDPEHLTAGTGSSWVWQTWAPTLTNLSGGTLNYAKFIQDGKTVQFRFKYTLASAGVSGLIRVTLPVTSVYVGSAEIIPGSVMLLDIGTSAFSGVMVPASATAFDIKVYGAAGTYVNLDASTSSTIPHTWASGDVIYCAGSYEAA